MMTIPDVALANLHDRYGHVLSEYEGLAEALYDHEQDKKKAAPAKERLRVLSGFRMSLSTRSVVQRADVGIVLQRPANRA